MFNRQEFDEEPFPVIGSDLLHGSDDDENPIDSAPTVIQKFDDEVPATAAQLGDESDDASNEKNGVGQDNETDDDEDIPNVPKNMSQPGSSKKASRPSLDISRGSTPKTPEPDKAATSSSSRKRKAGHLESPDIKRPGRATAAAASEAIKAATAKRPKAVPGSNVRLSIFSSSIRSSNSFRPRKKLAQRDDSSLVLSLKKKYPSRSLRLRRFETSMHQATISLSSGRATVRRKIRGSLERTWSTLQSY